MSDDSDETCEIVTNGVPCWRRAVSECGRCGAQICSLHDVSSPARDKALCPRHG